MPLSTRTCEDLGIQRAALCAYVYPDERVVHINQCHKYYQVEPLVDIVCRTTLGRALDANVLGVNHSNCMWKVPAVPKMFFYWSLFFFCDWTRHHLDSKDIHDGLADFLIYDGDAVMGHPEVIHEGVIIIATGKEA